MIKPIDISNPHHVAHVMKLCKRNHFYEDEMYSTIHQQCSPNAAAKLPPSLVSMVNESMITDDTIHGFFAVKQNKIVGFILFTKVHPLTFIQKSELLYVLIDHQHRGNHFSTMLMHHFMEEVSKNEWVYVNVHVEPNIRDFYTKFGFEDHDDLFPKENKVVDPNFEAFCTKFGIKDHKLVQMYFVPDKKKAASMFRVRMSLQELLL
jgi:ribosomal protein S18 acetylase RimI-like enzyme